MTLWVPSLFPHWEAGTAAPTRRPRCCEESVTRATHVAFAQWTAGTGPGDGAPSTSTPSSSSSRSSEGPGSWEGTVPQAQGLKAEGDRAQVGTGPTQAAAWTLTGRVGCGGRVVPSRPSRWAGGHPWSPLPWSPGTHRGLTTGVTPGSPGECSTVGGLLPQGPAVKGGPPKVKVFCEMPRPLPKATSSNRSSGCRTVLSSRICPFLNNRDHTQTKGKHVLLLEKS